MALPLIAVRVVNANDQRSEPEQWLDSTVRNGIDLLDVRRRDFVKATGVAALLGSL